MFTPPAITVKLNFSTDMWIERIMVDVALFPIPECVSFPGTVFPLHVFEPRYRAMVRHCIDHDMPMGVCHTQKLLHPGRKQQTLEQALHSNQATYKPFEVFSAGHCELVQTLDDGRMLINVHISQRYHAVEARQTLPFSIYACETYEDRTPGPGDLENADLLRQKILKRLQALTAGDDKAGELLTSGTWQDQTAVSFSFEIVDLLQLDASFKQQLLEMRSPVERLNSLLRVLNK